MLILGKAVLLLYICSVCTSSVSDFVQIKRRVANGGGGTDKLSATLSHLLTTAAPLLTGEPRGRADIKQILSFSIIDDLSKTSQDQELANRSDSSFLNSLEFGLSNRPLSGSKDEGGSSVDDELDKVETHTNNHQLLASGSGSGSPGQHSRHYNYAQLGLGHSLHSAPHSISHYNSKYFPSSSYANTLNLNYIHNLLVKPNSPNSMSGMLSPSSNSLPSTSGSSYGSSSLQSGFSSHFYFPSTPSSTPSNVQFLSNPQPQTQESHNSTGSGIVIEFSGSPMCGRQQVGVREPRIVGGNSTYEGEFPWAVSIQRHGNHHCGGVIVAKRWILTAAHCVRSQLLGNLVVRTGGHTLTRSSNHINSHLERDYLVDQIVMHGDFSRYDNLTASQMKSSANTNNADIALLRLKHDIQWNEFAWPVCFPSRDAGNFSGHDATVIGWGKLNEKSDDFSNELQKVKLTIIDNKVCQNWFRQAGRDMPIDERIICAGFKSGGKDACHGDSGGPLLSKVNGHYVVVGVVSTGIGCARPLLPGLYSRVSSYISWIESYVSLL